MHVSMCLQAFDASTQRLSEPIVQSTIEVFNTISEQLLPTPSKRYDPPTTTNYTII